MFVRFRAPSTSRKEWSHRKTKEMSEELPNAWLPLQFVRLTLKLQEIIKDFPDGLDYMITGVGTGGHITGCAQILKQHPNLKVFAVEPEASPVISGGALVPILFKVLAQDLSQNLYTELLDGAIQVKTKYDYTRRAAKEEGMLVGISSGASLAAVAKNFLKFLKMLKY
jgi:cysteine synthase A